MRFTFRSQRLKRRGSTTLEFAVLLPLLTTIALLCVDFGRFAHTYIAVTNAARAGAGIGSMNPVTIKTKPLWDLRIRQAVEEELEANDWFDSAQLSMPAPDIIDEGNAVRRVRVDVTYPFQTLINWPFVPGYNDPFDLRQVVVMRLIR